MPKFKITYYEGYQYPSRKEEREINAQSMLGAKQQASKLFPNVPGQWTVRNDGSHGKAKNKHLLEPSLFVTQLPDPPSIYTPVAEQILDIKDHNIKINPNKPLVEFD